MKIHQKERETRKTASFSPTKASKEMSSMSNITSEKGEKKKGERKTTTKEEQSCRLVISLTK